jgi:hypothetical protein
LKIKRVLVPVLILVFVAAAAFWLAGCTSLQLLNATVSHRGYVRTTDIPYGSDPRQKLDVYLPKKRVPNAKVVIFFYGGSWRDGSKTDYRFVAQALTSRGFIVVLPDLRGLLGQVPLNDGCVHILKPICLWSRSEELYEVGQAAPMGCNPSQLHYGTNLSWIGAA